jgi:hypothetical protein
VSEKTCSYLSVYYPENNNYQPKVSYIENVKVYSSKNNKSMRLWYNPYYVNEGWINFWVNIVMDCMHETIMREIKPLMEIDNFYGQT